MSESYLLSPDGIIPFSYSLRTRKLQKLRQLFYCATLFLKGSSAMAKKKVFEISLNKAKPNCWVVFFSEKEQKRKIYNLIYVS